MELLKQVNRKKSPHYKSLSREGGATAYRERKSETEPPFPFRNGGSV